MPDLTKSINDFDGTVFGEKAMEWIERIEKGSVLYG